MAKQTLLLYIPALHQGYLQVFEEWASKVDRLAIMGSDIINDFPEEARDLRAIEPQVMQQAVKGLDLFKGVEVLNKKDLVNLIEDKLVMSDEILTETVVERYFSKKKITLINVFLRWDAKNVKKISEIKPQGKISRAKFDRDFIAQAEKESEKSSDWFRHVGAVAVRGGKVLLATHNQRQPTAHTPYIEGDPRNFVEYGTDTHLRNTMHAEQMIITQAAKQGTSLEGASLYVNVFPCPDCAQMIAHSGIKKLYYSSGYAALDGERILKSLGLEIILVQ